MIVMQVVPKDGKVDVYRLLRAKVLHEATTWSWGNKAKTRLRHVNSEGYIDVRGADGVLVAHIYPSSPRDVFYLSEKFLGRLAAWFEEDLAAINVQFVPDPKRKKRRRSR
ncbi:MAG: hypothetical protein HYW06_07815 [Gemmatimonadetes bacterium]|nr:hypothetical protein [Gemmatimonadota bacterium]MBI2404103.1 hypothetical protein [Gemmatimonadota bacterium]MBI2536853.1 hypothetical protein [Gemmatimonadota bacterium]MBI2616077.1 hypothetical protein [Gemmatimonadota bacterium]